MHGEASNATVLDGQLQPLLDTGERSELIYDRVDIEKRQELEAALVKKLDRRMSILVLIYILNCTYLRCFLARLSSRRVSDIDRNNAA